MGNVKFKAKSLDEAIAGAAGVLGVETDDVGYRVISEGRPGMLGIIGGEEMEIEAWKKLPLQDEVKDIMQEFLNKMYLMAIAESELDEKGAVLVDVKGEDLGQIIGKDGSTLLAIQVLISAIISHRYARRIRVYVDAGGYKKRQAKAIERLAKGAAADVESTGEKKVLPPLSAAERRIVHMALRDNSGVETFSEGEGKDRRLTIAPKN